MLDNHALLLADCRRAVEKSRITGRLRHQTLRSIDRGDATQLPVAKSPNPRAVSHLADDRTLLVGFLWYRGRATRGCIWRTSH